MAIENVQDYSLMSFFWEKITDSVLWHTLYCIPMFHSGLELGHVVVSKFFKEGAIFHSTLKQGPWFNVLSIRAIFHRG